MKAERSESGQFTGRHMLAIMLAFFGVIIAVNITMAVKANTSWTGLVVKNTYIASQQFNGRAEEGRRQAALGWSSGLTIDEGRLRYTLADAAGAAVQLSGGTANFRRPVSDSEDVSVTLESHGDVIEGATALADGAWIVESLADAGLDWPYRETRRLYLRGGTVR